MSLHRSARPQIYYFVAPAIAALALVSCGANLESVNQTSAEPVSGGEAAAPAATMDSAAKQSDQPLLASTAAVPSTAPKLIKQADIVIEVESLDESLDAVASILQRQQGDVLNLQDSQPSAHEIRRATMRLRVPQENLDATLKALKDLGAVTQQSVTAEDVSTQLVDLQARVRNLRKSEESLLKIMERSGSIAEVLEVSREISTVREGIEQLDAQLKNLQNQVAYSTVTVTLESAIAPAPVDPIQSTLGDTWEAASRSVSEFTVGLLGLGLWLLAYSPYFALILGVAYASYRWRHRTTPVAITPSPESPGS